MSQPLHQQIAGDLRRAINQGDLPAGSPVPSEHALMRRYGVSRGTVRQARAALRAEGAIGGSRGRPLLTRGPRMAQPMGQLISFTAWVRDMGKRPSAAVVRLECLPASPDASEALDLAPGSMCMYLVRTRYADGEALLIERTSFSPHIEHEIREIDLERESIYESLERRGILVASARHQISAVAATKDDAGLLRIPISTALLRVKRVGYDAQGVPIEFSEDRYFSDRVNFVVENTATSPGAVRYLDQEGST